MGRFNIDDILRDLGEPNPSAPVERVPARGEPEARETEAAPTIDFDTCSYGFDRSRSKA